MTRQASTSPHDPVRSECFTVFFHHHWQHQEFLFYAGLIGAWKRLLYHNMFFWLYQDGNICRRAPQTSKTTEAETFFNIAASRSWPPVPRSHQLPSPNTWNANCTGRSLEQRTTKLFKITDGTSSSSSPRGPKVGISVCEANLFVLKFPFQHCWWINTQTIYFSLRPLSADAYEAGKRQEETVTRLKERYLLCTRLYGILKYADSSSTEYEYFLKIQKNSFLSYLQKCKKMPRPEKAVIHSDQ